MNDIKKADLHTICSQINHGNVVAVVNNDSNDSSVDLYNHTRADGVRKISVAGNTCVVSARVAGIRMTRKIVADGPRDCLKQVVDIVAQVGGAAADDVLRDIVYSAAMSHADAYQIGGLLGLSYADVFDITGKTPKQLAV